MVIVYGYKSVIVNKTNGFRKFLREKCDCDEIQGEIQSKSGEFTSMDDVIARLIDMYRKKE